MLLCRRRALSPLAHAGGLFRRGSLLRAADILRENGLRRPFVIASRRQCADEHFRALQEKLDEQDILLSIFSSVEPNPSVETVEKDRRAVQD